MLPHNEVLNDSDNLHAAEVQNVFRRGNTSNILMYVLLSAGDLLVNEHNY